MIYELNKCPICGSSKLTPKSRATSGNDIIVKYLCQSCDSVVSYEPANNNLKEKTAREIYNNALKSVIEITSNFNDESSAGTGILLKDNYVLTNAHVISCDGDIAEEIYGNFANDSTEYNLDVISLDEELDIALLKIEDCNYTPCNISDISVNTGDKIYAIGNAIGQGLTIVEGIVSDSSRLVNGNTLILHSAAVNHGNSGGPLYNTNGEIVGMVSSARKDAKSMSYAIPNKVLIEFINL